MPATGQLGLGLGAPAPGEATARQPRQAPARFKKGTRRLFVGPLRLDEYLKEAGLHWVLRMSSLLDDVDVSAFEEQYEDSGRHAYHPRMMLGLILYGMLEKKWSLRELESLAARDVGAWWICGGLRPDHSTIGRFVARHEAQITEEFFIELTKTVVSRLHLRPGEAVIDGTVIEAAASHLRAVKADALAQASKRANEAAAANPDDAKAARKAAEIEEAKRVCDERDAARKAKNRVRGGAQVVPGEPEAVVQQQKDGSVRPSYKPSMMVHPSGLVTGFYVDPTSETAAVEPLVSQHRKVFDGAAPECTMLDAGFFSAFVLSFFYEQGLDVLCPSGRAFGDDSMTRRRRNENGRFLKSEFTYDEHKDAYICPAERLLVPHGTSSDANGPYRRFRGTSCTDCPMKAQCTTSAARTLKRYEHDDLKEGMTLVMRQPAAKKRFRSRSCGERPFAGIKRLQGLTRFRRRGLRGAFLETALQYAAWNVRVAVGALAVAEIALWGRSDADGGGWRKIGGAIIAIWMP